MHKARHERPATGSKINWKSGDKHDHGPASPFPRAAEHSAGPGDRLLERKGKVRKGEKGSDTAYTTFGDRGRAVGRYFLTAVPLC